MVVLSSPPAPASCEQLWPKVWAALRKQEFTEGRPPFFDLVADAEKRLGEAWVGECRRFTREALACARGQQLEKELAALKKKLRADKVPKEDIDRGVQHVREHWSILECKDVDRAIDRAAGQVAADAGL